MSAVSSKISLIQRLKITKRDLGVFALTTAMFTSIAAGAVTLDSGKAQAASTTATASICSAAKYFR